MPIEIKELHIKIAVGENESQISDQSTDVSESRDEIIEACVEQVLEILSNKEER
ncbi:DUF5908 family protein [Draconibacterium sp. IB214405]|uniref:DUF5908 family protein n=1 Tax=Draconibacterium sp. IB214405 TaxID=3097352 RepID=UPI002A10BB7A|nr:DUF5908 family protein [Draconibacterium sp. IB214405]MDX8339938.1 DUF5908 family protein [Draconibacterium sp. IB214405]